MSKNCSQIAFFLPNQILPFPSCMTLVNLLDLSVFYFPNLYNMMYSVHQFNSVTRSCPTLCNTMNCSMSGLPVHHQLPESTQIHVHWVGDAIQTSHLLSSPSPPAFNLCLFNESALHIRYPKYWTSSFNISPSNGHPGLISFRMD